MIKDPVEKLGLPPGTLVLVGDEEVGATHVEVYDYDEKHLNIEKNPSLEILKRYRRTPTVTWINIEGLQDLKLLEQIGIQFGLHPLVMEDIAHTEQRPKIEFFDDYVFMVVKMVRLDENKEPDVEQVSLVFGRHFCITFQEKKGDVLDPLRKRLTQGLGRIRKEKTDYLAYCIVDLIVDHYFVVLDALEERAEIIEEMVLNTPHLVSLEDLHRLRTQLMVLRKAWRPMRELISVWARESHPLIETQTQPYLRDLYDHIIRVLDGLETQKEMIAGLVEMHMTQMSNHMNEIMKVLTIIATIFIPITFLAGVYGMNFEHMPELKIPWAYPAVWAVFILIAAGMVVFFKRRKWL